MKLKSILLLPLVFSAAYVSSADANAFHNPRANIVSNIGSAPNPTSRDVRMNRQPQVTANANAAAKARVEQEAANTQGNGDRKVASAQPSR